MSGARNLATKLRDTPAGRILPAVVAEAAVNPEMRNSPRRTRPDGTIAPPPLPLEHRKLHINTDWGRDVE